METKVTEIVENDVSIVSNLDKLTSRSMEGLSIVSCRFKWGTKLDEAANDIRDRLEFAKRRLPDEIETPIVFKFNTSMIPILFIGASSSNELYPQLYHIVDKQVSDYLKRIPGVGAVQIYGGLERQININLDTAKLQAYNLSARKIAKRLAEENISLPAGNLKTGRLDYNLRLPAEFENVQQIKDMVISADNERIVYLKDVAKVEDSFKEESMVVRNDGKLGMMLMVQKRSGANTVEIAQRVKKELAKLKESLPYDLKFSVLLDGSEHISQSIRDLTQTIYWGGIFVVLVVLFFLRQIYPSLIIALSIPFSLIIAFIFMYFFGYTINIMSLSSLAIAIGMVVDNAIVVVDNAYRFRERGLSPKEAAISGAVQVELAVSASTLTTIVVFLPMVFLSGVVGIMFKQLAILITVTLLASLFTALTFSPMLCSKLLNKTSPQPPVDKKKVRNQGFYQASARIFQAVEDGYGNLLKWALNHKKTVVITAGIVFILSLALTAKIGTEFIPEEDTGDLSVQIELPVGTRYEETLKTAIAVEDIFKKDIPEALTIFSRTGQSSSSRLSSAFGSKTGPHIMTVQAKLCKVSQRKRSIKEIAESVRPKIRALAGVKKIMVQTGSPFSRILFGGGKPVSLEIYSHNLETANDFAQKLKSEISQIEGITDTSVSRDLGRPELRVMIDRVKASSLGLSVANVSDTLRTYFYGTTAAKFRQEGDEYDIFLRLRESERQSLKDIENIPIYAETGKMIQLSNIAKVIQYAGPIEIERQNQQRIIKVEANIFRRSLGEITKDVRQLLSRFNIPQGINRLSLGSDIEEQGKAFKDLILLFVLGGILVYMVMAALFESFLDPFIVMFSVPFAFTGVALGLFIGGVPLSVLAFLGLVMLSGIVVNNAIVLVDYINILRRQGLSLTEAIISGGSNRLRPVLMTTITTLFGMLPLALSKGEGSELWRPLGVSMLGGLSISTFITLVLVPVVYAGLKKKVKVKV